MVGYKWRRFQIVKKGVFVHGMEFYEKKCCRIKRSLLGTVESLANAVKGLIEVTGKEVGKRGVRRGDDQVKRISIVSLKVYVFC